MKMILLCLSLVLASTSAQYAPKADYNNVKGVHNVNNDYLNKFPYNYRYVDLPKQAAPQYDPNHYTGSYQAPVAPPAPSQHQQPYYDQYRAYQPNYQANYAPQKQAYQPSYTPQKPSYQPAAYQPNHGAYQPNPAVYQPDQGAYKPPPPPTKPTPPPPELKFIGKFTGTCTDAEDGLYYVDYRSFAYCSNNNKAMQNCAEGSANPDYSEFRSGKYNTVGDFCSINRAASEINGHRQ